MAASDLYRAFVWQNKGCTLTARVRSQDGSYLTQASVASIAGSVYDLDNGDRLVTDLAPVVGDTVFDTLQAAPEDLVLWTRDGVVIDGRGWNWRYTVPKAAFPLGAAGPTKQRRYRLEFVFVPAAGEEFVLVYETIARDLKSVES